MPRICRIRAEKGKCQTPCTEGKIKRDRPDTAEKIDFQTVGWYASFRLNWDKVCRARRGASGALYLQSAIAELDSLFRSGDGGMCGGKER